MTNVSQISAKPPATTTSKPLSPELRELLASGQSADDALAAAANSPALIAEAQAALPGLWKQVDPAGDAAVVKMITARLPLYPQSQRSQDEWANWWGGYFRVLSDQPAAALEAGMCEWEKTDTSGFLPKPGQLLALVKQAAGPHWQALSRANRIAKLEPAVFVSAETLEERRQMAEQVRAALAPRPTAAESTDETTGPGLNP